MSYEIRGLDYRPPSAREYPIGTEVATMDEARQALKETARNNIGEAFRIWVPETGIGFPWVHWDDENGCLAAVPYVHTKPRWDDPYVTSKPPRWEDDPRRQPLPKLSRWAKMRRALDIRRGIVP